MTLEVATIKSLVIRIPPNYLFQNTPMKILHIISSINPKGGGPMEGVRQVGMKMIEMGHSISVLTLDDPAS
ncbi:MAG: hypothetical protein K9J22_05405, partial [Burkholderiaceae bacterium]|nr:hypothetical protein [Burkholderiaceae bacterium]